MRFPLVAIAWLLVGASLAHSAGREVAEREIATREVARTEGENGSVVPAVPKAIRDLVAIQDRVQKSLPAARAATVGIVAGDGTGSGVVVSGDGLVLTAGHVSGEPGREVTVVFEDGSQVKAKSLGRSKLSDAGMVKIVEEGIWPSVPMLDAKIAVEVGNWVFALGHPGGFDGERGTVFRYGRVIRVQEDTLQTDCKLQGGDSGGPLFDLDGNVIGIHSRIWRPLDHNFHVTIGAFRRNWDPMLAGEIVKAPDGSGGAFLGAGTTDYGEGGVLVEQIIPGSSADESDLKLGDIIQKIDATSVRDTGEFSDAIRVKEAGEKILIQVLRDGVEMKIKVTLGRRP